jgi:hypothetical protein
MSFNFQKISVVHSDSVNHVCLIPTEFQPNQPIFLGVSERRGQKEYVDSFLEKSTTPQSPTHCIVLYVCIQNQINMVGRTKIVTLRTQRICVPLLPSTLMFSRNVVVRCCSGKCDLSGVTGTLCYFIAYSSRVSCPSSSHAHILVWETTMNSMLTVGCVGHPNNHP